MEVIYISLFWSFCMVGAFCVGGGYASIPLIQTQVIDVHHWISFSEFMDVVAISQMTPGPIGIICNRIQVRPDQQVLLRLRLLL